MITNFIIFGLIGWCLEVVWTGLGSLIKRDFSASSKTSIWMFFIYGSAALFTPVIYAINSLPLLLRGIIYATCIFAIEYGAGIFLRKLKVCPWDYSGAKFNIQGVIRLDYTPVWFAVGLFFEFTYLYFISNGVSLQVFS